MLEHFWNEIVPAYTVEISTIGLILFGSIGNVAKSFGKAKNDNEPYDWGDGFISLIVAAITGLSAGFIADIKDYDGSIYYLFVLVGAFAGPLILDEVGGIMKDYIKEKIVALIKKVLP